MFIVKVNRYIIIAILAVACLILLVWGGHSFVLHDDTTNADSMMIGLICTDAEDEWKQEMYQQVSQSAKDNGVTVIQIDTERTLSAQIDAMRSLIMYGVDTIVVSPITENGWNYVVQEACDAGTTIISLNEKMNVEKEFQVYQVTYRYQELAQQVLRMMSGENESEGRHIIEFKGLIGSFVSEQISRGLRNEMLINGSYVMNFSYNADFMRSRAKEQIESMLRNKYPIETIIAHNDAMALGAADALLEAGLVPGSDVEIVAFGGGKDALEALEKGFVNYIAVCDLSKAGEEIVEICQRLKNQEAVPMVTYLDMEIMTRESYGQQ